MAAVETAWNDHVGLDGTGPSCVHAVHVFSHPALDSLGEDDGIA